MPTSMNSAMPSPPGRTEMSEAVSQTTPFRPYAAVRYFGHSSAKVGNTCGGPKMPFENILYYKWNPQSEGGKRGRGGGRKSEAMLSSPIS